MPPDGPPLALRSLDRRPRDIGYCQASGILVEGFSPLATGAILENGDVQEGSPETRRVTCGRYGPRPSSATRGCGSQGEQARSLSPVRRVRHGQQPFPEAARPRPRMQGHTGHERVRVAFSATRLTAVSPSAEAQLRAGLESVELKDHARVMRPDRPIRHVYAKPVTDVIAPVTRWSSCGLDGPATVDHSRSLACQQKPSPSVSNDWWPSQSIQRPPGARQIEPRTWSRVGPGSPPLGIAAGWIAASSQLRAAGGRAAAGTARSVRSAGAGPTGSWAVTCGSPRCRPAASPTGPRSRRPRWRRSPLWRRARSRSARRA